MTNIDTNPQVKERYVRTIINEFPYPVSSSFVRLRTDECLDPGPRRLKYILMTGEAVSRFLGIITLCECREKLETTSCHPPSASLSRVFKDMFKKGAWGAWLQFLSEGQKFLSTLDTDIVMPELAGCVQHGTSQWEALNALSELLEIRNDIGHGRLPALHDHEFTSLCEKTYPLLVQAFERLDFLADYNLAYVSLIEVRKHRLQPASFHHRFKGFIGNSTDFHGFRRSRAEFLESNAIFINAPETHRYLNLDPLLLYEEAAGKAPDVFYYDSMKHPKSVKYNACKHGGEFNSRDSRQAVDIADEFENMLTLFSEKEGKVNG